MRKNKILYGRQHIDRNDIKKVQLSLKENFITTGKYVRQFEINLKKKFGSNCIVSKKITDYISIDKAANAEKKQINLFKKKGFILLNKKPGGSLGSITGIWTKEAILKSAKRLS